MGLKELKKEIIRDAERDASEILKNARAEADSIIQQANLEVGKFNEGVEQEIKSEIGVLEKREKASAEFEAKKMVMQKKRELLEKLLSESLSAFESLPEKRRRKHISRFLKLASARVECSRIICSQRDAKILKGKTVETADIIGGIMVENKDGSERIDLSYETVLQIIFEHEFSAIAKIMFS